MPSLGNYLAVQTLRGRGATNTHYTDSIAALLEFTGAADGLQETPGNFFGDAAGTMTFTGSVNGIAELNGVAAGTMTFTGAVAGSQNFKGTLAGTTAFTGSLAGLRETFGTAAGTVAFTGAVDGTQASPSAAYSSIQHFSITISGTNTSATATISSVDTSLSTIMWGGIACQNDTQADDDLARITLTNGTTITATRVGNTTGHDVTIKGTVVEWDSDWIQSIQRGTITITNGGGASATATISSVTTANTYVAYLGHTHARAAGISMGIWPVVSLTNSTTVTATANAAPSASQDVVVSYEVVEFKSAVVDSIQYAQHTGTATGTTQDVTISAVTTGDCIVIPAGFYHNATSERVLWSWHLQSSTNVRFEVGFSTSNARRVACWVVELDGTFSAVENINDTVGYGTSDQTLDTTITTLDTTESFLTYGGITTSSNNGTPSIAVSTVHYKDTNEVTWTRINTAALTADSLRARSHTFI